MSDEELLKLFYGMSESMQKAVIEIMLITQVVGKGERENDETRS